MSREKPLGEFDPFKETAEEEMRKQLPHSLPEGFVRFSDETHASFDAIDKEMDRVLDGVERLRDLRRAATEARDRMPEGDPVRAQIDALLERLTAADAQLDADWKAFRADQKRLLAIMQDLIDVQWSLNAPGGQA